MTSNQLQYALAALMVATTMGSMTASAEILYKWRETDGSITFSPTPPDASLNIKYEKVNSSNGKLASSMPSQSSGSQSSGSQSNGVQALDARPNTLQAAHPQILPRQSTTWQSTTGQSTTGQSTTRQATPRQSTPLAQSQPVLTRQNVSMPSGSRKTEHCNELRKRVLSLEKLLTTKISAQTMDNAVVQMARYQNGINQSCGG